MSLLLFWLLQEYNFYNLVSKHIIFVSGQYEAKIADKPEASITDGLPTTYESVPQTAPSNKRMQKNTLK